MPRTGVSKPPSAPRSSTPSRDPLSDLCYVSWHAANGGLERAVGWNDAQIAGRSYYKGRAEAKARHQPICLVIDSSHWPACCEFSRVFYDHSEDASSFAEAILTAARKVH